MPRNPFAASDAWSTGSPIDYTEMPPAASGVRPGPAYGEPANRPVSVSEPQVITRLPESNALPAVQQLLHGNYQRNNYPGISNTPSAYPDLSGMAPVNVEGGNTPAVYGNYPTPGGGTIDNPYPNPGYVPDNWAGNAASGYGFAGRARGLLSGGINSLLHLLGVQGNTNILGAGGNYPDLSSNAGAVFDQSGYPIPGPGGTPSGDWRSNATQSNGPGYAGSQGGFANAAASSAGFGGGLTSQGAGGWQTVSNIPSGLGSMSWQQALGGGFQHYQL